jgi:hypothetical protein
MGRGPFRRKPRDKVACEAQRRRFCNLIRLQPTRAGIRKPQERKVERAAGIEPASLAWKAKVLPLHNARACAGRYSDQTRSSRRHPRLVRFDGPGFAEGPKAGKDNHFRPGAHSSQREPGMRVAQIPVSGAAEPLLCRQSVGGSRPSFAIQRLGHQGRIRAARHRVWASLFRFSSTICMASSLTNSMNNWFSE